jgi:ubiquinone/menaquinone biosynthesis C-methylase UbiE
MFELTPRMLAGLPKNGPTDPIEYYRRPLIGRIFRERINRGLRLLPQRRFARALEVGYGAGAVQLALADGVEELHGIDLDADAVLVTELLAQQRKSASLRQGSVYELPYDSASFDLCVSFSEFEHLHEYRRALAEVARVLKPGGLFLLGMPAVNKLMEAGFLAIGFKGINDHHVTTPRDVIRAAPEAGFRVANESYLDLPLKRPFGARVYYDWLLEKPLGRSAPVP